MSILIVDDNREVCELMGSLLEMEGWKVRCCTNPMIVFEMIRQRKPKVLITDLLMTGLDGRDLLSKLKNDHSTADILTILVSAHPDSVNIAESLGTEAYISKPFDVETLVNSVRNLMQKPLQAPKA
ncbi:response regulator [Bergeyella sp. RCAD1439]|uniref:response regulator n=1 Tax=Bergeyella anatis TaxID=3113737 RepID=UPI002E196676|nr:response regulator [Bergeyella sp. RCAD1439]